MPKVIFKFDKREDWFNYWHKTNYMCHGGKSSIPRDAIRICKGKKFEACKKELEKSTSKIQNSKVIPLFINASGKYWRTIEKEFFKRMDKLMKNKFNQNIKAYLTTLGICPYNPGEPSFMFTVFSTPFHFLRICGHEIMHLYFHKFYWNRVEKEIGNKKTEDLKEALTVLLNHEFRDLWFVDDEGYDKHKELREFIEKTWKKNKDFDKLMDKCVKHLK